MSGLPGQTIHTYVDTLSRVIDFDPEHISAYSLSIEEGTPFANDPSIIESLPPEMIDRRMYEITKKLLSKTIKLTGIGLILELVLLLKKNQISLQLLLQLTMKELIKSLN